MGFDRLSDILKKVQQRYPVLSHRLKEAEALSRWESAVGPIIAKHARAVRVQDRRLWVEVDHPIWRSELHHRKRQILELLNQGPNGPVDASIAVEDLFLVDRRGIAQGG